MNEHEKKKLGMRIKECRNNIGHSQEVLAEKLGMKRTNITNYEAGRVIPPGNILMDMSDIFNVSTDFLLGISDNPHRYSDNFDEDLRQIQRAKRNLSNQDERLRMDRMIEMIKLSFVDAFNEEDEEDEDDDL